MDAHSDTAVAESPEVAQADAPNALDQLPDANPEPSSFSDALESALSQLSGEAEDSSSSPAAVEVAQESPQVQSEPAIESEPEPESKDEPADSAESDAEEAGDKTPLESLTEDVGDWTPKAANRFKQLKSELKSSNSELEQLRQTAAQQEQKIKEMSGLIENRDIDKLQESVADYEYEMAFQNLEETALYKQQISEPLANLVDQANQIAAHYDVSDEVMLDIISLEDAEVQDNALKEHFGDASDRDRATLYRIIDSVDPLLDKRQELYDNVESALNEAKVLEEQRENEILAENAKFRADVTRNVTQRVTEKLPFLSGVEGLDMSAVEAKAAEMDPSVVHPVDFAYNAVAAQLLPIVVREYMSSRKDVDGLMDKLSEYEDAEPNMSGTPASDSGSRATAGMSFEQAISNALGS